MKQYINLNFHPIPLSKKDICEQCGGTGFSGAESSEICINCMGLGSHFRVLHGIFRNEERTNKFGSVAMMLLGMVLMAAFSSTGQIKARWLLRLTGFYFWVLLTGLMYNIISIPRFFARIFGVS